MTNDSRVFHCPRCRKAFTGGTPEELLEYAKKHVEKQHPDHDPDWWRDD